jgi:AcrR family transcriptional regulator
MPARSSSGHVRPLQARSQRTLDALLDAAAALLRERPYHELGVSEIIRRAGSSTGSFYARFPDKSSLLHALHERNSQGGSILAKALREECTKLVEQGASGSAVAHRWVARVVRGHRSQRGVLRAVAIEAFQDERYRRRARTTMSRLSETAAEVLRPFRGKRTTRAFDADVAFAVRLVIATLDQQLFLPLSGADALAESEATLVRRLTDVFVRYVQLA